MLSENQEKVLVWLRELYLVEPERIPLTMAAAGRGVLTVTGVIEHPFEFADSPDDDFYSVAMEWDDLELDSKYCEPETVFKDPQQLELTL